MNGFGGRIKLPLAMFGVASRGGIKIVRVNVDGFNRVSQLASVIRPSVTIVAGVNVSRVRGLGDRRGVLGTGLRVLRKIRRNKALVLGNSSPLL